MYKPRASEHADLGQGSRSLSEIQTKQKTNLSGLDMTPSLRCLLSAGVFFCALGLRFKVTQSHDSETQFFSKCVRFESARRKQTRIKGPGICICLYIRCIWYDWFTYTTYMVYMMYIYLHIYIIFIHTYIHRLPYITSHSITLYYITLHHITLHYIHALITH